MTPLTTHEIGSLAKPSWRVKALRNLPLNAEDIAQAKEWGEKLHIDSHTELLSLLKKESPFTPEEKQELVRFSSLYGTRFLEEAGLDIIWDGEQHRVEMYEYPIKYLEGFSFHGHVRSFDNKYYRRASCEAPPKSPTPYHLKEYEAIKQHATRPIKIPITGAYTLADWSYDTHYCRDLTPGIAGIQEKRKLARHTFIQDMSRNVIYPNLKALYDAGAHYLQIDEPAATTKRAETDLFIDSIKESIGDLAGKAFFTVHICYSVYSRLFPKIQELEGFLDEIHLEYANRDSWELGTDKKTRTGYEILYQLRDTSFKVGLGVVDIHTDRIESPELIRDRILHACEVIGDPGRILVTPDCGLRTRTWKVSFQKLQNLVKGRDLARSLLC